VFCEPLNLNTIVICLHSTSKFTNGIAEFSNKKFIPNLYWMCFQSILTLLPKCFVLSKMVIETFLFVDYTISVLSYIGVSAYLKIWAWLKLGHTQDIGVAVPRGPLVKFLEITTGNTATPFCSTWHL